MRTTSFAATALATAMALAIIAPVSATPLAVSPTAKITSGDVEAVRDRRGFYRHGDRYYLNGHRGSRHYYRGWRQHNAWWFPPAAFALGLMLGSGQRYVQPAPYGEFSGAHYRWCEDRYRSYRAWDNSFQPYNGPRRRCWSPYN